jgi:hypothetical protein
MAAKWFQHLFIWQEKRPANTGQAQNFPPL